MLLSMLVRASGQGQNHADQERYNPPHHHAAGAPASLRFDYRRGLDLVADFHVLKGLRIRSP
jgi:hypothetical protein